jgi:hypothetical protein
VSGDGRAGATAPTTTDAVSEAAVAAYIRGYTFSEHLDTDEREARRDGLRAAFPVMLAAWIYRLTPEQLSDLDVACERAMTTEDLRAALTRLGGAHE